MDVHRVVIVLYVLSVMVKHGKIEGIS